MNHPSKPAAYDSNLENFRILKEEELHQIQEDNIAQLSSVLFLPRAAACLLLHKLKWNVHVAQEAWFDDEDRVRKAIGLLKKPVIEYPNGIELVCGMCFQKYIQDIRLKNCVAFCGHPFCSNCLGAHVSKAINAGPGCLSLRCLDRSCGSAIGEDMVNLLASDDDRKKYGRYLVRSYTEENRNVKRCPAPNCDYLIEYKHGSVCQDVTCICLRSFCWDCGEDAHSPVNCNNVAEWIWGTENREMARRVYGHYYDSWAANKKLREKALEDLHKLTKKHAAGSADFELLIFFIEGWQQIVEYRRFLEWTYAGAYYLQRYSITKIKLFEFLQGEAEVALERLHQCASKELEKYLMDVVNEDEVKVFRRELTGLIEVTKTNFIKLKRSLSNGLSDAHSYEDFNTRNQERLKAEEVAETRFEDFIRALINGPSHASSYEAAYCSESIGDADDWQCQLCTCINKAYVSRCCTCDSPCPLYSNKACDTDYWQCKVCTSMNEGRETRCKICTCKRGAT